MLALWSSKDVQGPESPDTVEFEAEHEPSAALWVYLGGAEREGIRVVEIWL